MPIDYEAFPLPHPAKLLESMTYAAGEESRHTAGYPVTRLTANYTANGTSFTVKSTWRFASSGSIRVLNRTFSYTSKTSTSFEGLSGDFTLYNLPKGARVISVTSAIQPALESDGIPLLYVPLVEE